MRKKTVLIMVITFFVAAFTGCTKHEKYPIEPHIEFYSFTKIPNNYKVDDKAILSISFTDGDGDIGLEMGDTMPPYNYGGPFYYNCFIDYYEKRKGEFVKVELPSTNNARIPKVNADLPQRGIRGNIEIELFINNILSPYDTIKFSIYIVDRALHKSNQVETPEIIVDKTP